MLYNLLEINDIVDVFFYQLNLQLLVFVYLYELLAVLFGLIHHKEAYQHKHLRVLFVLQNLVQYY